MSKDESVEKDEVKKTIDQLEANGKKTWGFAVNGAPIWLCKELSKEAKAYYGDVYWPVIVDWYRKAKEFENVIRGGLPSPEEMKDKVKPQIEIEEKEEEPKVQLFGGNVGE